MGEFSAFHIVKPLVEVSKYLHIFQAKMLAYYTYIENNTKEEPKFAISLGKVTQVAFLFQAINKSKLLEIKNEKKKTFFSPIFLHRIEKYQ